jgi:hypothetical protein
MNRPTAEMTDPELDEVILDGVRIMHGGLRQAHGKTRPSSSPVSRRWLTNLKRVSRSASLDLVTRGLIEESEVAPRRWMIAS